MRWKARPCCEFTKPVSPSMLSMMPFSAARFSSTVRSKVREVLSRFSIVRWMLSKALGSPWVALSWNTDCRLIRMSSTPAINWSVFLPQREQLLLHRFGDADFNLRWQGVPGDGQRCRLRPATNSMALVPKRSLETILRLGVIGAMRRPLCSIKNVTCRSPLPSEEKLMARHLTQLGSH